MNQDRWKIGDGNNIFWNVTNDTRLPHEDHIEMSGRKVSVIVRYRVDENRRLTLSREVLWPTLRTKKDDVRGYLRRIYGAEFEPVLLLNDAPVPLGPVSEISFYGILRILHAPNDAGIEVARLFYPAMDSSKITEEWLLIYPYRNGNALNVSVSISAQEETQRGVYGEYRIVPSITEPNKGDSPPLFQRKFEISYAATCPETPNAAEATPYKMSADWEPYTTLSRDIRMRLTWRDALWGKGSLTLKTPRRTLNEAFEFAKLRAAESLFETKMGLVHSPGGGRYYGGIWNNDQCEYSGPLFGYLGDADAKRAALTAYRNFAPYMTPEYKPIPTSLEMEGTIEIHAGGDRGDAAMYAGGAARFALTTGDQSLAEELYPHIAWCLEYCKRKTNAQGVVESDTDELEGRFPTGTANLSTSCLAYDAYRRAADLARSLENIEDAADYDARADQLADAIESYFGATVEGYETYRYYDGNETLRAWICLPLVFGLPVGIEALTPVPSPADGRGVTVGEVPSRLDRPTSIIGPSLPSEGEAPERQPGVRASRLQGTIAALFSPRLWTADGLATEAGDTVFWDRATLYALRGVFFAGATETALEYLEAYSRRRLLGDHVPYPVEAYPEGGQAHLAAESALYCRVFTEGMFGLEPTGLRSFRLTPRLPQKWPQMALRNIHAFGHVFSVEIKRDEKEISVTVTGADGSTLYKRLAADGETHSITLPV